LNEQKSAFRTKQTRAIFFVKSLQNGKTLDDLTTKARIDKVVEELYPNAENEDGIRQYTSGRETYASFRSYQIENEGSLE